jgi:hypothetical protein
LRQAVGHNRLELSRFLTPPVVADHRNAPVNALGYLRVMFTVEDIDDTLARLRKRGAQLVGEVVQYEDAYRLCYIRGPEGLGNDRGRPLQCPPGDSPADVDPNALAAAAAKAEARRSCRSVTTGGRLTRVGSSCTDTTEASEISGSCAAKVVRSRSSTLRRRWTDAAALLADGPRPPPFRELPPSVPPTIERASCDAACASVRRLRFSKTPAREAGMSPQERASDGFGFMASPKIPEQP